MYLKSDREFIDGIYEKANRLSEEKNKESYTSSQCHIKSHLIRRIVSIAACVGCVIVVGSALKIGSNKKTPPKEEGKIVAITSREEVHPPARARVMKEAVAKPVEGKIQMVTEYNENQKITIFVDKEYQKQFDKTIEVIWSDEFYAKVETYLKEKKVQDIKGKHLLLFIEPYNLEDYYKVSNEEQGVYFSCNNQGGEGEYESIEGIVSTREELFRAQEQTMKP